MKKRFKICISIIMIFMFMALPFNFITNNLNVAADDNQVNTKTNSGNQISISDAMQSKQSEDQNSTNMAISINIIVKYKNLDQKDSIKEKVKKKHKLSKLVTKKFFNKLKMELLEVDNNENINLIINDFKQDPNVEFAQPDYKLSACDIPQDPMFSQQWGLLNNNSNTQNNGQAMDIDIVKAWDIIKGSDSIVVGVLDTGIDINHTDLKDNIYTNTQEILNDGVDSDGNGYIDDVHGWNFIDNNDNVYNSPSSDSHGTHIAGIIAASMNREGTTGVAPKVKILPLKFINGNVGYTSDAIEAIEYAKNMGIKIINCSWGCTEYNTALKDEMGDSNILFVCAAGNNGNNIPVYPAAFGLPNIVSVGAIDDKGSLAPFSNYGDYVDVAAPGVSILSTLPNNDYGYLSGTSMAAPFVTGEAALILSHDTNIKVVDIKSRILQNVTILPSLSSCIKSGGIINTYKALGGVEQPSQENSENQNFSSTQSSIDLNTDNGLGLKPTITAPPNLDDIKIFSNDNLSTTSTGINIDTLSTKNEENNSNDSDQPLAMTNLKLSLPEQNLLYMYFETNVNAKADIDIKQYDDSGNIIEGMNLYNSANQNININENLSTPSAISNNSITTDSAIEYNQTTGSAINNNETTPSAIVNSTTTIDSTISNNVQTQEIATGSNINLMSSQQPDIEEYNTITHYKLINLSNNAVKISYTIKVYDKNNNSFTTEEKIVDLKDINIDLQMLEAIKNSVKNNGNNIPYKSNTTSSAVTMQTDSQLNTMSVDLYPSPNKVLYYGNYLTNYASTSGYINSFHQYFYGSYGYSIPHDIYNITVTTPTTIRLNLSMDGSANLKLDLSDPNNNIIQSSGYGTGTRNISYYVSAPGTYHITITPRDTVTSFPVYGYVPYTYWNGSGYTTVYNYQIIGYNYQVDIYGGSYSLNSYYNDISYNYLGNGALRNDTLLRTGDEKWYRVSNSNLTKVYTTLQNIPLGCDYDVDFYNCWNNPSSINGLNYVGSSRNRGNLDEKCLSLLNNTQDAFIRVSSYSGGTPSLSYGLLINTYKPDSYELNESNGSANIINLNQTINATIDNNLDVDWYKISLTATSKLNLKLANIPVNCDYDISIYDSSLRPLGGSYNRSNNNEDVWLNLAQGDYYINVYSYAGANQDSSYALTINKYKPDANELNENNNTAKAIILGNIISGTIDNQTDQDWYSFNLTTSSNITVNFNNIPSNYNYYINVLGSALNSLSPTSVLNTSISKTLYFSLASGLYYIQIGSENGYDDNSIYNLMVRTPIAAPTEDGTSNKNGSKQYSDFNIVVNAETGTNVTAKINGVNVLSSGASSIATTNGKATLPIDFSKLSSGNNSISINSVDCMGNISSDLIVSVIDIVKSLDFKCESGMKYYVPYIGLCITDFNSNKFVLEYDSGKLSLDESNFIKDPITKITTIKDTNITVNEFNSDSGKIVFTLSKALQSSRSWSGVLTIFKFVSILQKGTTSNISIRCYYITN